MKRCCKCGCSARFDDELVVQEEQFHRVDDLVIGHCGEDVATCAVHRPCQGSGGDGLLAIGDRARHLGQRDDAACLAAPNMVVASLGFDTHHDHVWVVRFGHGR